MRIDEHEKDNTTTHFDDGIRVNKNLIGVRLIATIFDKNGILCAASGFDTDSDRDSWIESQLVVIRKMDLTNSSDDKPLLEF